MVEEEALACGYCQFLTDSCFKALLFFLVASLAWKVVHLWSYLPNSRVKTDTEHN